MCDNQNRSNSASLHSRIMESVLYDIECSTILLQLTFNIVLIIFTLSPNSIRK